MEPIVSNRSEITVVGSSIMHVKNLRKTAEWYSELLSMPLNNFDESTPFYEFDMSNHVNLMLDDHRNMPQEKYPIYMLKTNDIDRSYAFVKDADIPVVLEIQRPHPGLSYFNVEDSEGNVLMITQSDWVNPSPVVPSNPDHPVKNHIRSIVVPVQNLKRATEWYSNLLNQPIKPERVDGGPIYWFDMENGTGILLDDNRNNTDLSDYPTLMLRAENIKEAYQFLVDKGADIVRDIQFDHYFMVKDIEGNMIMICA
ncbi:hypothetical protein DNH61_06485 [Paenibacillus sambharensis]|uniref:Glyoxalase/fosfomycin resistance/dioxygenase domain-containing protein n=1 Tax=Paenibacillus sambharensis TaxID=1803190 RepID=A0A2W1LFL6_9BACL|nr:VOC family protein [Paenibacillus sambharensis]PZD96840.1 hypothetical protein DNH61_06485 [Paenibacillus sambharensis]